MGFRRWFGDLRPGEQVLFGAIAAAVIGAVITGMFTLEATGSAGAPGEDSSGRPSYHPPSVPTRPGTDLPTADNTASTSPTSTPSPSLASAGPVDLTSLRPSSSDMEYDIAASRMGGVSYPLALKFDATSSNESTVEYAFSNQYSTMKGWLGLDDDSPNSHAVAHVRLTDERDRLLAKIDASVGRPQEFRVDVRGVIVLRIHYIVGDTRPDILIDRLPITFAGVELSN